MGKEKSRKKKRSSSESSSSSSSSDSSREKKRIRKLKKKLRKEQKKTEKIIKKKLKKEKKRLKKEYLKRSQSRDKSPEVSADIPVELMEISKAMAPMTKEEWEKKQSIIRRVLDEETGRYRLIKGDGEVLEEIVSKERHKEINRQATQADGALFQAQTLHK
ncbi:ADP-ribosylation factor-like protein 6-interacting protein 4 [Bombyx mori]|uniref:ADP-ribosylation factor-like protein 6-interacting protein 4 n=1 Tax=Bombyx mori TaxID=7091 RepID=A0A8R2AKR9_BOMMO|nr:ADP-ribosylation factor-like protein 6-interacting protein 4 isoform X1 [Bombyx mori]